MENILWTVLCAVVVLVVVKFLWRPAQKDRSPSTSKPVASTQTTTTRATSTNQQKPTTILRIVYSSQKGTAKRYATQLSVEAEKQTGIQVSLINVKDFEFDEMHLMPYVVFVVSTYTDGKPPVEGTTFHEWLEDTATDHRVPKSFFDGVNYAIFGCGNSLYKANFNKVAREMDEYFGLRSAKKVLPSGMGDEDTGEMDDQFKKWTNSFWRSFKRIVAREAKKSEAVLKEQLRAHALKEEEASDSEQEGSNEMLELEDMGKMMTGDSLTGDEAEEEEVTLHKTADGKIDFEALTKPMVHPTMQKALTKQGYKLIGTHSGVKLCRWTKAMLRGRGGCYKHTFYGISSYQCMEMTPSLACANKCVFCWRHHTNPVAKEWKWKVDKPDFLIEGALQNHVQLIKSCRGVPGVQPERFQEAQTVKHCALSLVGEPIIYPYINELVDELHSRDISTFMVTNAQFPDQLATLKPVTQLYLSIDASTKESLKVIDRPLFADYWERFLTCIQTLKEKGQRTVFRMTLVKEFNMEEVQNYAELVKLGLPDFIEVKGVTYCGTSDASFLTIKNTPFHQEVRDFCAALCQQINKLSLSKDFEYELACEHEHSLCMLMANKKKFYRDGKWHTWIDYPKFFQLERTGKSFASQEYMAETPSWAVYGSEEKGFDPEEVRFMRKGKGPTSGC